MPFPLIPVAIAIVAVLGTAAVAAANGWFSDAKGKKLVLIGPKRAGKSTWRTFLQHGVIPAGYEPTTSTERVEEEVRLSDLGFGVTIVDVSGSDDAVQDWHREAARADIVCFFVDGSRLLDDGYYQLVQDYSRVISSWEDVKAPRLLILTHADKLPDGPGDFRESPQVANIQFLLRPKRTIVADLSSIDGCRDLTVQVLGKVEDL